MHNPIDIFRELEGYFDRKRTIPTWSEAWNESFRPSEGAVRTIQEIKSVKVKCVYPDPDDGVSYSWVKVDAESQTET